MVLTLQHRPRGAKLPRRRLYARYAGASMKRVGLQLLLGAVVMVLILALSAMGGGPHRPITAVRVEVEVVAMASSVAIIDPVCITNTPTLEPC